MKDKPQVIAIEEHHFDAEIVEHFDEAEKRPALARRLLDFGEQRIRT